MAKDDDDFRERRRKREEEDAAEQADSALKKAAALPGSTIARSELSGVSSEKVDELIKRADPLIEQVNSLYNQYMAGVETRPPLERRQQIDQLMYGLSMMTKPTQGLQFRYQTVNSKYVTYKARWDKLLKDLEDGKIKRLNPKRGA